jgi:isoquinoline 1-oxidoreductase subunit alpha
MRILSRFGLKTPMNPVWKLGKIYTLSGCDYKFVITSHRAAQYAHDAKNKSRGISRAAILSLTRKHAMAKFTLNGKAVTVDVDPATPILWTLRDNLNLTGTKFGCGAALCGACTVHLNGNPIRACITPVSAAEGASITTIEAMAADKVGKAVQDAWVKLDVPQCGYCQSGQIMSATALLRTNKSPSDADIDAAMSGNICRCGTYQRIRAAIKDAGKALA